MGLQSSPTRSRKTIAGHKDCILSRKRTTSPQDLTGSFPTQVTCINRYCYPATFLATLYLQESFRVTGLLSSPGRLVRITVGRKDCIQ